MEPVSEGWLSPYLVEVTFTCVPSCSEEPLTTTLTPVFADWSTVAELSVTVVVDVALCTEGGLGVGVCEGVDVWVGVDATVGAGVDVAAGVGVEVGAGALTVTDVAVEFTDAPALSVTSSMKFQVPVAVDEVVAKL